MMIFNIHYFSFFVPRIRKIYPYYNILSKIKKYVNAFQVMGFRRVFLKTVLPLLIQIVNIITILWYY